MKPDKRKVDPKSQYRINEEIRVREVRVVDDNGATVMSTRDALELAQHAAENRSGSFRTGSRAKSFPGRAA